jgi:hypothetical protein
MLLRNHKLMHRYRKHVVSDLAIALLVEVVSTDRAVVDRPSAPLSTKRLGQGHHLGNLPPYGAS